MNHLSRSNFLNLLAGKNLSESPFNGVDSANAINSNPIDAESGKSNTGIKPYQGDFGRVQLLHLLRRTLFGATGADYNYFANFTLNECVDRLLMPAPLPPPPVNAYNDNTFTDPDVPFGDTWVLCTKLHEGIVKDKRRKSLVAWWVGQQLNQDRSLTEKMTLFLHNHIAIEFKFINDAPTGYVYVNHLRTHALGSFKKLMLQISTSTAMLEYLGGAVSTSEAPNENYSRELQELFTVGKGPGSKYTQDDVVAAARIMTGWTFLDNRIKSVFIPERHDSGDKQFSEFYNNTKISGKKGQAGEDEVKELIDMIFGTKEVARNLSRCLYRWFVSPFIDENVERNMIEPMADILIANDFEMASVLRALLCSEHFFDSAFSGQQIKNPVDYLVGLGRQFNVSSFAADLKKQYQLWELLSDKLQQLSMCPGWPPNVAGWPAYYLFPSYDKLWINSDTLVSIGFIAYSFFRPDGKNAGDNDAAITPDVLGFTARLSNPANVDQLIAESTALLSPVMFDNVQLNFLKMLLLNGPEQSLASGAPDHRAWSDAWNAYAANPVNAAAKAIVLTRLCKYYSYLLKQPECMLY